jgi:hypothetical protein
MPSPIDYRRRAEECRAIAAKTSDRRERESLLLLSETCELLARREAVLESAATTHLDGGADAEVYDLRALTTAEMETAVRLSIGRSLIGQYETPREITPQIRELLARLEKQTA